jgi:hypothetical protein
MSRSSSVKLSYDEPMPTSIRHLGKLPTDEASAPLYTAVSGSIRLDKVQAVRRQLADGSYDVDEHLDAALEKALETLAVRSAQEKIKGRTGGKANQPVDSLCHADTCESPAKHIGAHDVPLQVFQTREKRKRSPTQTDKDGL